MKVNGVDNISFDNWGGFSSLSNFDNFFGSGHFNGFDNQQVIVEELVCSQQQGFIIQQQLSILQEVAKQIILEQSCDVESQILFLDQFRSGFFDFEDDLRRSSGRSIGFDSSISILLLELLDSNGSLNSHDFGFNGGAIGRHFASVGGSNWDDQRSPSSISALLQLISSARNSSSRRN
ncbi:hypothetical protein CPC08DRAFT_693249 [Agrocybe pediades]|nr:hypothetical protein CPC08DRAFT_693249 [Agrocybe pediades]